MNLEYPPADPAPEKEVHWSELSSRVENIVDGLGRRTIDENIKETVVGLMANGFNTEASCGGHFEEEEGFRFPSVDVGNPGRPKYRYEGEEECVAQIINKYNLSSRGEIYDGGKMEEELENELSSLGYKKQTKEYSDWYEGLSPLKESLGELLAEFNKKALEQAIPGSLKFGKIYGACRIEAEGSLEPDQRDSLEREDLVRRIKQAQIVFDHFGKFLKERYFGKNA